MLSNALLRTDLIRSKLACFYAFLLCFKIPGGVVLGLIGRPLGVYGYHVVVTVSEGCPNTGQLSIHRTPRGQAFQVADSVKSLVLNFRHIVLPDIIVRSLTVTLNQFSVLSIIVESTCLILHRTGIDREAF